MKAVFNKILECLLTILPVFRKKGTAKEFTELITGQYGFLMEQLEKALKDYFELSAKVKEMHTEMMSLRSELVESLSLRCRVKECGQREAVGHEED